MPRASAANLVQQDGIVIKCATPTDRGKVCGQTLAVGGRIMCPRGRCKSEHEIIDLITAEVGVNIELAERWSQHILSRAYISAGERYFTTAPSMPEWVRRRLGWIQRYRIYPVFHTTLGEWVFTGAVSGIGQSSDLTTGEIGGYLSLASRRLGTGGIQVRLPLRQEEWRWMRHGIKILRQRSQFFCSPFWVGTDERGHTLANQPPPQTKDTITPDTRANIWIIASA